MADSLRYVTEYSTINLDNSNDVIFRLTIARELISDKKKSINCFSGLCLKEQPEL